MDPFTPVYEVPLEAVNAIRQAVKPFFEVADTSLDVPQPGMFRFRGRAVGDLTQDYDHLRPIFESYGFTPILREESGRVALIGLPVVMEQNHTNNWHINLLLVLLTIFSTLFVGVPGEQQEPLLTGAYSLGESLAVLWSGWPYMVSIMLILGCHELGHYFAARYHGVPASLPYFIPLPLVSPFGTMGAFILQRGFSKNVRVQFDIGIAGPLAGLVFAIPLVLYGLWVSPVGPLPQAPYCCLEGNSIFYYLAKWAIFGQFLPSETMDVSLGPVAWAGWVGLLVTGINLLPAGQLDGGRITQALIGTEALDQLFWPVVGTLVLFSFLSEGGTWLFMVMLLLAFRGRYEEPLDGVTKLDPKRRILGIITMIIFLLIFVPFPLHQVIP